MNNRETLLIVSLTQRTAREMRAAAQDAFDRGASAVEVRLDYLNDLGDESFDILLADLPGPCVVTCRSVDEGGQHAGNSDQRWQLLERAAAKCPTDTWIDFELEFMKFSGPPPHSVDNSSASGLLLSAHDFEGRPQYLEAIFDRMANAPGCDVAKVAWTAESSIDCFIAMDMIRKCPKPAISIAMGQMGQPSRLLAKRFGAFGSFGALESDSGSAPGQATLSDMINTYRWNSINGGTRLFGVVGCPVGHSLSPHIHNAAFDATGYNGVYVPWHVENSWTDFDAFIEAILNRPWLDFVGLSVTIPHKSHAIDKVGPENVDELSRRIGVINTIRFTGQSSRPLVGTNTDYPAVVDSLASLMGCEPGDLAGLSATVLGAGGVARAAVAALADSGVNVTIYNRTLDRAAKLAADFDGLGGSKVTTAAISELKTIDSAIAVNCTSVGMHPDTDACPLADSVEFANSDTVVFDTIYTPQETALLARARQSGCRRLNGLPMLVSQAAGQLKFWLDMDAPQDIMLQAALKQLK